MKINLTNIYFVKFYTDLISYIMYRFVFFALITHRDLPCGICNVCQVFLKDWLAESRKNKLTELNYEEFLNKLQEVVTKPSTKSRDDTKCASEVGKIAHAKWTNLGAVHKVATLKYDMCRPQEKTPPVSPAAIQICCHMGSQWEQEAYCQQCHLKSLFLLDST